MADAGLGGRRPRLTIAVQLAAMIALSFALIPAVSPARAVMGGLGIKLLFLARMAILVAVATVFLRLRGLRWADVGLRRPRLARLAIAIPLGLMASIALVAVVHAILGQGGNYATFNPIKGRLGEYLFWLLPVTWGSAALGEELTFRGFFLDALERLAGGRWAPLAAIIAQAALFGLFHLYQGLGGVFTAAVIGVVLGAVRLLAGRNLWAGVVIHGLIDSAALTAIFLFGFGTR